MKAIEINGEIKTFGSLPKKWQDENGLHLNIGDGSALGFKDVVYPEFDARIQQIVNLHLDPDADVFTYDVEDLTIEQTLSELKEGRVRELKMIVNRELSNTDWYVIRHADSGEPIPNNVQEQRSNLRLLSNSIEAEINSLTTKKAVVLFDINI